MNRRHFLYGAATLAIGQLACSDLINSPTPPTAPVPSSTVPLTARVNITQLAQAATQQQCEEWCWAACISTMFNFYNHPLTQAQIVAATYGAVICLPANSSTTIGRDLSRRYVDNRGVAFTSRVVAAYDFYNRINSLNNGMIVNALASNNPLLYCNTHHAMVIYSVTYRQEAPGPSILDVEVMDPWPFSPITHSLTPSEMFAADLGGEMTFLAQVQIT